MKKKIENFKEGVYIHIIPEDDKIQIDNYFIFVQAPKDCIYENIVKCLSIREAIVVKLKSKRVYQVVDINSDEFKYREL